MDLAPVSHPRFLSTRTLWKALGLLNRNWMDGQDDTERVPAKAGEANLVSSRCGGALDWHMPVLDIDFDAHLEPSSTEGHYHLYLNRAIPWDKYEHLLHALYAARIIEEGFYRMSIARHATFVRYPGVRKLPGEEGSG